MATGLASGIAASILDALCRSVTWTEPAAFYVKLHISDPGVDGTSGAFGDTTRQAVTFSAASGGTITNSADVAWTNLSATNTISHVSFWDASTSGTFLGSDALETSRAVQTGDNFTISAGDLDITLSPIAAA